VSTRSFWRGDSVAVDDLLGGMALDAV